MDRRICIRNQSGTDGDYVLFMSVPFVFTEDGGPMYQSVFVSRFVPQGSQDEIYVDDKVYAWQKNLDGGKDLGYGSIMKGGTSLPVSLGQAHAKGATFVTETTGRGSSVLTPTTYSSPNGRFDVRVQNKSPKRQLIGIAKGADNGNVVPVVAMEATHSFSYSIEPVNKFYVARLEHAEIGLVVDVRSLRQRIEVDFTSDGGNRDACEAIVTHTADGRLGVEYGSGVLVVADNGMTAGLPQPQPPSPSPQQQQQQQRVHFQVPGHRRQCWSGVITWPDSVAPARVIQDSGTVIGSLAAKYGWSAATEPLPAAAGGGVSMTVRFWLRDDDNEDEEQRWRQQQRQRGDNESCDVVPDQDHAVYREDWRHAIATAVAAVGEGGGRSQGDGTVRVAEDGDLRAKQRDSFTRLSAMTH